MSSLKKILESIKNIYSKITSLTTRVANLESKTVEMEWTTCTMESGFINGALASSRKFNVHENWKASLYKRKL